MVHDATKPGLSAGFYAAPTLSLLRATATASAVQTGRAAISLPSISTSDPKGVNQELCLRSNSYKSLMGPVDALK